MKDDDITLVRSVGKIVGPYCSVCVNPVRDSDFILRVVFSRSAINLCVTCEGKLLEKLVNNYVKRRRRNSKVGFVGDIGKE